jgi:hypothetical protein
MWIICNMTAKSTSQQHENVLIQDLVATIGTLPGVQVETVAIEPQYANKGPVAWVHPALAGVLQLPSHRFDAQLRVAIGGTILRLLVEVRAQVFPREAHDWIRRWHYSPLDESTGRPADGVVIAAKSMTPAARLALVEQGIGYFVEGGSLCLPFKGAFAYIDRPTPKRFTKDFDIFTEARTPVLHEMLQHPNLPFTVHDLASRTGSSSATVSRLLTHLEQEAWVELEGSGPNKRRRLTSPGAVLDAWVAAESERLPQRKERRFFVPGLKATSMAGAITRQLKLDQQTPLKKYHVTAEAAAQLYAPHLTSWNVTTIRATPEITSLIEKEMGAKEVPQGFNLLVIEDNLPALRFFDEIDGVAVASPLQTYVDLMCSSGRALDAGKFLRQEKLSF